MEFGLGEAWGEASCCLPYNALSLGPPVPSPPNVPAVSVHGLLHHRLSRLFHPPSQLNLSSSQIYMEISQECSP